MLAAIAANPAVTARKEFDTAHSYDAVGGAPGGNDPVGQ
jgi:hypothetical protein